MSCSHEVDPCARPGALMLSLLFSLQVLAAPAARADASSAELLVSQAEQAFAERRFDQAELLLSQAQSAAPEWHELEFNQGVNAEGAGRYLDAARHYRAYAAFLPRSDAEPVEGRARLLSERATAQPHRRRLPWWGWGLIGAGVVGLAAGLATALSEPDSSAEDY